MRRSRGGRWPWILYERLLPDQALFHRSCRPLRSSIAKRRKALALAPDRTPTDQARVGRGKSKQRGRFRGSAWRSLAFPEWQNGGVNPPIRTGRPDPANGRRHRDLNNYNIRIIKCMPRSQRGLWPSQSRTVAPRSRDPSLGFRTSLPSSGSSDLARGGKDTA